MVGTPEEKLGSSSVVHQKKAEMQENLTHVRSRQMFQHNHCAGKSNRHPPMHVPRRIPRMDPMEDMHGHLLMVRRGRWGDLDAAVARWLEGRARR